MCLEIYLFPLDNLFISISLFESHPGEPSASSDALCGAPFASLSLFVVSLGCLVAPTL